MCVCLLKKGYQLHLDIDTMIHLFNSIVLPVLNYGSEVWGFDSPSLKLIDRVQLRFFKMLLKLNKSTPGCMIYGELGILPATISVKQKLLGFWSSIVNSKKDKIICKLYHLLFYAFKENKCLSKWILSVKSYLDNIGLSYYWINHDKFNVELFKHSVKLRFSDIYKQEWFSDIYRSNTCAMYRIIKNKFGFESYLLNDYKCRITLCKLRLGNHKLPIVKGRFYNTNREERICNLCASNSIGDEFHYLFECCYFSEERSKYLKKYFIKHPNTYKMFELFNNKKYLIKLSTFINVITSKFK